MPRARKHIVCISATPYYHVYSRCVRRAFLCGVDQHSGKSYEHRRGWLEDRVQVLSSVFSVELCAYAIMSNHYHLVVKLNPNLPEEWSDDEVLKRWTALHRGPVLVQRFRAGQDLSAAEHEAVRSMAAVYRARLASLSWFMKCLNEPIARRANAEDGCSGHFWEARFHSQPLCSEKALLTAMAYVDLNPVRAGIADTPEESVYTSLRARLRSRYNRTVQRAVARLIRRKELNHFDVPVRALTPFAERATTSTDMSLAMTESEYLKLVDTTGRIIVRGKRGRIDPAFAPILERLGLTTDDWTDGVTAFSQHYRNGDLRPTKTA
ncbi:MAG: hypothetical protein QNJ00_18455 [Woeseiaceae bacterium]|nr:hypothetical protein [Woeseiaceae bacterium]